MERSAETICVKDLQDCFTNLHFSDFVPEEDHFYFLEQTLQQLHILETSMKNFKINKFIELPEKDDKKKKTLLLDLDETLIHKSKNSDFSNKIPIKDYFINIRPYAKKFIENISKDYEIFIFTAAGKSYSNFIIDCLDPERKFIDGIIHSKYCIPTKYGKIKDLKRIRNRNIEDLVLVDNNVISFGSSIDNGIPILNFTDNENDEELPFLEKFLTEIVDSEDVRIEIQKRFQLKQNLQHIITSHLFDLHFYE